MIVSEVMTTKLVTVTPDDTLSHAANLLRQYQFHHLPVVRASHTQSTWITEQQTQKSKPVLEGLLTAQDIDMAAAPAGDMIPLANLLLLTAELHIKVQSILAAPLEGNLLRVATVRLGTIRPTPLLLRLREKNIQYTFADPQFEGGTDDKQPC